MKRKTKIYTIERVEKDPISGFVVFVNGQKKGIDIPIEALTDPFFSPQEGKEIEVKYRREGISSIKCDGEIVAIY